MISWLRSYVGVLNQYVRYQLPGTALNIQGVDIGGKWNQYTSPLTHLKYFYNAEFKLATTVDIRNVKFRHDLLRLYDSIQVAEENYRYETFMEQSDDNDWFILKLDHAGQLVVSSNSSESTIGRYYKSLIGHFPVVTDIQGYRRYPQIKLLDLSAQLSMSSRAPKDSRYRSHDHIAIDDGP